MALLNIKNNHLTRPKLEMVIFLTLIAIKTTKQMRATIKLPKAKISMRTSITLIIHGLSFLKFSLMRA
ncbi:hypothetical protein JPSP56_08810 [Staphylococcus pseudintermedius]